MKIVLRTLLFHFLCILLFAFIYKHLSIHFGKDKSKPSKETNGIEMIDYLLLSVTIQAGIGFSDLYPVSHLSKLLLMIHQFIVISTHVFTLYIFTI
jgi:heme A synthase